MPSRDWVLKVPLNEEGYSHNLLEHIRSRKDGWLLRSQMARCKLLRSGLLVMERVKPVRGWKGLPEWTYGVDCCQVGYRKNGDLVAYDYA